MNEIKVTTELCAEDRARIDRLIAALESAGTPYTAVLSTTAEPEHVQVTEPELDPPHECGERPAESVPPKTTKADIRTKVVTLVGAKKKAEVEAIIKAYAPSVTELPDDKLDEVMRQLTELEKGVK